MHGSLLKEDFNAFRHANGTLMDRLGVPLKVRQQRLGHSDPHLTLGTYTHAASENDVKIAGNLAEFCTHYKRKRLTQIEQALFN
jgi:hypothetical protein